MSGQYNIDDGSSHAMACETMRIDGPMMEGEVKTYVSMHTPHIEDYVQQATKLGDALELRSIQDERNHWQKRGETLTNAIKTKKDNTASIS
eukprot:1720875-Amphidinium_carterae.1